MEPRIQGSPHQLVGYHITNSFDISVPVCLVNHVLVLVLVLIKGLVLVDTEEGSI